MKPLRFQDESSMDAYAFVATEEEDTHEPLTYHEPPGYEQGNKVRLLKKSFYGLKQSPRKWYKRFDEYMLSNGFKRSNYDNCVCYKSYELGKSKAEIGSTKSLLKKEFDMKDLGKAKKILGMEIVKDRCRKILKVSQFWYISKILNNFRIDNEKSVKMPLGWNFKLSIKDCSVRDYVVERMSKVPYANAVGILMYLMVCTRPDIAYAVSVVSSQRSPSKAIKLKTPIEMWSGHPSDYGMLSIFGCVKIDKMRSFKTPNLTDYELAWDRERRKRMKPLRFQDKSNMVACAFVAAEEKDTHEPLTYHEAVAYEDSPKWKAAMKEDMGSLRKNMIWEIVDHLAGQKLVSCKWLFKIKEGIKVRHTCIWVIPALTTCKDCELEQLDVKMTFLHGNLKESPRQWYKRFDEYMLSNRFKHSNYDSCVCYMSYALDNEKSVKMPLGRHFKPSLKNYSVRDYVVERMSKVPYANAVRRLMYLTVCTRPDIATVNVGLVYATNHGNHVDVIGFVDSDYANDPDKEAEYMALTEAVNEAIWLKELLEELGVELNTVVLESKTVKVLKVGTRHNVVDALTKVVPRLKLQHFLELLNVGVVLVSVLRSRANEARMQWLDSLDDQRLLLAVQYAHHNQYFGRKMIRSPRRMNLAGVHRLIR
nr:hypothetical protein [Tanacetum cinerariifolium]